jgi:hypothetical protein
MVIKHNKYIAGVQHDLINITLNNWLIIIIIINIIIINIIHLLHFDIQFIIFNPNVYFNLMFVLV